MDRLLQMLEDEKDKVSTWKEEEEELQNQLKAANDAIQELKQERDELQKALEETSWSHVRESLIQQSSQDREKLKILQEEWEQQEVHRRQLESENIFLITENERLKEELAGGSSWEKKELSLKLSLAEKQNRILELIDENATLTSTVQDQLARLEESQAEIEALSKQVESVSWAEEKALLMQELEEQIDKGSTWEEERTSLEQQLAITMEENASLKAENAQLSTSFDEVSWAKEREELCRALEEEKEKLSSWTEEIEALEEENKELKWVFHESKEKDIVIRDKEEAIEQLNKDLELIQSNVRHTVFVFFRSRIALDCHQRRRNTKT